MLIRLAAVDHHDHKNNLDESPIPGLLMLLHEGLLALLYSYNAQLHIYLQYGHNLRQLESIKIF